MNLDTSYHFYGGFRTVSGAAAAQGMLCSIDTGDHDGSVTWTIEATCRVSNAAETGTIDIQQVGGSSCGTATITGSTLTTRVTGTFTPVAGANQYTVLLSATGAASIIVLNIRVKAAATGATKVAFDIPMLSPAASTLNVSTTPTVFAPSRIFRYTAATWQNATFKLRACASPGASGTNTIGFYDGSTDAGTTTHSTGSTITEGLSSGMTLVDGSDYRLRGTASAGTDTITAACIRVIISSLTKLEVHHLVGGAKAAHATDWDNSTTSTTVHCVGQRKLVSTANYSALSAIYFEATGLSAAASGDTIDLRKDGTNDSGTAGTSVGSVPITSATVERQRSADLLSGWANERYYAGATKGGSAGQITGYIGAVIMILSGTAGSAYYYQNASRGNA